MIALGVQTWGTDLPALSRFWRAADDLGYARIVYGDGLWGFTHDGWTMLAGLAAVARRARLGPAVTYGFDPSSHHPSWLAKRASTVDHLSGGRLDLRLGVGAESAEAAATWRRHGIPYPPARERVARLEETAGLVRRLLGGETVTHDGPFYRLRRARLEPPALQRPAPPIWIAAASPGALAVTARCADGWEASYLGPAAFQARWERLGSALVRAGRDPSTVRRSVELDVVLGPSRRAALAALDRFRLVRGLDRDHPVVQAALIGDAAMLLEKIAAYAKAGATDLTLGFADFPSTDMLERFAADVLTS